MILPECADFFLGGAIYRIPVLIDGFISSVAALCAVRLAHLRGNICLHPTVQRTGRKEGAGCLGMSAMIVCDLSLGEGSGAVAAVRFWKWDWMSTGK